MPPNDPHDGHDARWGDIKDYEDRKAHEKRMLDMEFSDHWHRDPNWGPGAGIALALGITVGLLCLLVASALIVAALT